MTDMNCCGHQHEGICFAVVERSHGGHGESREYFIERCGCKGAAVKFVSKIEIQSIEEEQTVLSALSKVIDTRPHYVGMCPSAQEAAYHELAVSADVIRKRFYAATSCELDGCVLPKNHDSDHQNADGWTHK